VLAYNINVTKSSSADEIANVNFLSCARKRLCAGTPVYQTQWNNAMERPLRLSRSFKVTDFGTNWKLIYEIPVSD